MADRLRQREIADRDDVRCRVSVLGVASAIGKCVELLGITEVQTGLIVNPGPEPAFKRTMLTRIKRTERQYVRRADAVRFATDHKSDGLIVGDRYDRRVEADTDGRVFDRLGCQECAEIFRATVFSDQKVPCSSMSSPCSP